MTFEQWCTDNGVYLSDKDDGARAARLMAQNAWDAAVATERERCAKACETRSADHWHDYKDRASEFLGSARSEAMSDEAELCAAAIRKAKPNV